MVELLGAQENISFEQRVDLFEYTLDGEKITPTMIAETRAIANALCPLCNNERHAEIDAAILSGRDPKFIVKTFKVPGKAKDSMVQVMTERDVRKHIANHLIPVYAFVSRIDEAEHLISENSTLGGVLKKDDYEWVVPDDAEQRMANLSAAQTGTVDVKQLVLRSGQSRYMIGRDGVNPYKAWGYMRMRDEIKNRANNSINFLDEMMNLRNMSYRVYEEIMDSGDVKLYGTAISAVKEIRGVMETLGKMSLIAKKLGEDNGGVKRLSEPMQDMIRRLGVLQPENNPTIAPSNGDVVEDAYEAEKTAEAIFRTDHEQEEAMEAEDDRSYINQAFSLAVSRDTIDAEVVDGQ